MDRGQKGGFQKRINSDFNSLTRHAMDCGACMVNYFGGDRDFTEEMYRKSIGTGLQGDEIVEHLSGKIKETELLKGRSPDDINCRWISYPPRDVYGGIVGWSTHDEFIMNLEKFYNQVLPGYTSMVAVHPPSGVGHYITMGKEENGTEILYCPQSARYVRGRDDIVKYFYHFVGGGGVQGIHAFSVLLCETTNGTQYVEGRGSLGSGAGAGPGSLPRSRSEESRFLEEAIRRSMKKSHRGGGTRKNRKNMSKKKKSYRGGGNKKNTKRKSQRSK